jgi:glyoxylase-like metal-dependent hydrolase (beta-lactamase superfamily II)
MKAVVVPVTPFQQNCSIIWDEATHLAAVVDPGGEIERILGEIDRRGLTLQKILLTHAHLDHAAGTAKLAALKEVPIEGPHRDDQFLIDELPAHAQRYGFPPAQSFTPDRWLDEGDRIRVGGDELTVTHCPGHTPGHVVLFHERERHAWVGDVLFAGSIGRSDLPRGNQAALVRSIRTKLFPLGDDVTFVPGHGPTSTFGRERRTNPFVADHLFSDGEPPTA